MGSRLDIYIEPSCPGCQSAQELAQRLKLIIPELEVRIHDLARPNIQRPASVFAVPTYVLNGITVSLGTPELEDLVDKIEQGLNHT